MPPLLEDSQDVLDFASAFEDDLKNAVASATTPPAEPAPAPEVSPDPAPAPENITPPAPENEPAPAPALTPAVDWEARARALEAQINSTPTPQPAPQPAPTNNAPPLYTPDEMKELETYRTDWPDIAKAESLARRQEYKQLLDYVFQTVEARLAPIASATDTYLGDSHYGALVQAHSDYDELVDDIEKWINTQPTFLRNSLTAVAQNGDTKDVIDLVSMYKQANGIATQAGNTPPVTTPPVVTPPNNAQPAKQAAVQRLSPVSSQRSNGQAAGIPDTFEEAFKAFSLEG